MISFKKGRSVRLILVVLLLGVLVWWYDIETRSRYQGVRHPYLQAVSTDGITIRWVTPDKVKGWVLFGSSVESSGRRLEESAATTDHSIRVEGLRPDSRYYYAVGEENRVVWGGDQDYWFKTLPSPGSEKAVRVWAVGDIGHVPEGARRVEQGAWKWLQDNKRQGSELIDAWITLGDNSGHSGTNREFQDNFFSLFAQRLSNYSVWPVIGNHDGRSRAYSRVFSPPQEGESGGSPSGTYKYYSFDVGSVHFVALDSQISFRWGTRQMLDWLKEDLASNRLPWVVAYFHHPPYSKASHDSDSLSDSRGRMHWVREKILPIIEASGVDLVLSGHSHSYERSFLLAGHYGSSDTLQDEMVLDRGDGREDGDGAYRKSLDSLSFNRGTVYVVAGSSSKVNPGEFNHPVMYVGMEQAGSLVFDVVGERLELHFVGDDAEVKDYFTIEKDFRKNGFEGN